MLQWSLMCMHMCAYISCETYQKSVYSLLIIYGMPPLMCICKHVINCFAFIFGHLPIHMLISFVGPPAQSCFLFSGYSAAVGKFDATRQLYYVSGAPRSNERGEVIFFRRIDHQEVLHYTTEQKLEGERDFAGFGSSLLALDLNNDG